MGCEAAADFGVIDFFLTAVGIIFVLFIGVVASGPSFEEQRAAAGYFTDDDLKAIHPKPENTDEH